MPSAVAVYSSRRVTGVFGLKTGRPPLEVALPEGRFFVGEGAHDWGQPVENLDFQRLTGSPEMKALFCGAMTRAGVEGSVELIVGLPVEAMTGPEASATVKAFLRGVWAWTADGRERRLEVREVTVTSQTAGALFDYFLDLDGRLIPERRGEFACQIGILNIGMNTLDLMVVQKGEVIQRMTGGETLGVRRLLSMLDPDGLYTIAEMDTRLRRRELDLAAALPIWEREVFRFIEKQWRRSWRRFARIIAVGGGALLLARPLAERFEGKVFLPDDPVMATARGMWKLLRMRRKGA